MVGFGVLLDLWFEVLGFGFWVFNFGFWVLGFEVLGCWGSGIEVGVSSSGLRVWN